MSGKRHPQAIPVPTLATAHTASLSLAPAASSQHLHIECKTGLTNSLHTFPKPPMSFLAKSPCPLQNPPATPFYGNFLRTLVHRQKF